jgi:hypothetical protein
MDMSDKKIELTEGQEVEYLSVDFSEPEQVRSLINDNESGMFGGKNNDGEDVMVLISKGEEATVKTFQENGWLRVNYYNSNGYSEGETFEGRHDKE